MNSANMHCIVQCCWWFVIWECIYLNNLNRGLESKDPLAILSSLLMANKENWLTISIWCNEMLIPSLSFSIEISIKIIAPLRLKMDVIRVFEQYVSYISCRRNIHPFCVSWISSQSSIYLFYIWVDFFSILNTWHEFSMWWLHR